MLLQSKTYAFSMQNLCFCKTKNIVLGSFRGINNIQNPPLNLQKTNYQRHMQQVG